MPTFILSQGGPYAMAQNVVFALPARPARIHSTQVLEISPDNSAWTPLAAATTGTDVASGFVRNTLATTAQTVIRVY